MTPVRLLAAPVAMMLAAAAAAQPIDVARQLRMSGQLDRSEQMFTQILSGDPANFVALYNMGLIYDARSDAVPEGEGRIRLLQTSAGWFDKAIARYRRGGVSDSTAFNSAGVVHLKLRDFAVAEQLFKEGLQHAPQLASQSRGKLVSNLGLLYALRGDTVRAVPFLRQGATLGNAKAQANLARLVPR